MTTTNENERINWSGWIYAGRVRIGWSGSNYNGMYNGKAANLIEVDGVAYPCRRGTAEQRTVCRLPENDPVERFRGANVLLSADGSSVDVVKNLDNARDSWADILADGDVIAVA